MKARERERERYRQTDRGKEGELEKERERDPRDSARESDRGDRERGEIEIGTERG